MLSSTATTLSPVSVGMLQSALPGCQHGYVLMSLYVLSSFLFFFFLARHPLSDSHVWKSANALAMPVFWLDECSSNASLCFLRSPCGGFILGYIVSGIAGMPSAWLMTLQCCSTLYVTPLIRLNRFQLLAFIFKVNIIRFSISSVCIKSSNSCNIRDMTQARLRTITGC